MPVAASGDARTVPCFIRQAIQRVQSKAHWMQLLSVLSALTHLCIRIGSSRRGGAAAAWSVLA
jgi:hypothetical protein